MPYPFSRGVIMAADPLYVNRNAASDEMEAVRQRLEDTLNEITRQADSYYSNS
jgi:lysophospholipid acyltransferase (LPLAT)-like uncharacterized protein